MFISTRIMMPAALALAFAGTAFTVLPGRCDDLSSPVVHCLLLAAGEVAAGHCPELRDEGLGRQSSFERERRICKLEQCERLDQLRSRTRSPDSLNARRTAYRANPDLSPDAIALDA